MVKYFRISITKRKRSFPKNTLRLVVLKFPLQVYLLDYGLVYRFNPDGNHKEYKEDPKRRHDGTIEFTSTDAHNGVGKLINSEFKHDVYSNNKRQKLNMTFFTFPLIIN